MVRVDEPMGVVATVVTVNVVEPGVPIEGEEKDAVAPAGKPLTVNSTVPENPNCATVETVYVVFPAGVTN
jgi:hypothetical protein